MDSSSLASLERFKRQYFQLLDLHELSWPTKQSLRPEPSQSWIYNSMFNANKIIYLPPKRYQARVLKRLLQNIEESIENPEEDEISDDLSSALALLMSEQPSSEAIAAQQPSYVTYSYLSKDGKAPQITILESRSVIASAGTTGRRTWEASLHLSKYLWQDPQPVVRGKRVLELGAGTGLVSILCARWLSARHVTATDGDDSVVEDMQKNIFLNGLETTSTVYAKTLRWGQAFEQDEGGFSPEYDLVLGADITYDVRIIPSLVATLRDVTALNSNVNILIAATIRNADTFSAFVNACEQSKFSVVDVGFPVQPTESQDGPFYAASVPIRIVRISSEKPIDDPFAI